MKWQVTTLSTWVPVYCVSRTWSFFSTLMLWPLISFQTFNAFSFYIISFCCDHFSLFQSVFASYLTSILLSVVLLSLNYWQLSPLLPLNNCKAVLVRLCRRSGRKSVDWYSRCGVSHWSGCSCCRGNCCHGNRFRNAQKSRIEPRVCRFRVNDTLDNIDHHAADFGSNSPVVGRSTGAGRRRSDWCRRGPEMRRVSEIVPQLDAARLPQEVLPPRCDVPRWHCRRTSDLTARSAAGFIRCWMYDVGPSTFEKQEHVYVLLYI